MQTPLQLVNTTAIPNVENTSKKGLILKEIKVLKKKKISKIKNQEANSDGVNGHMG